MRKSIVTLIVLIMGSALAQAQTEKGRWTVGAEVGNLSYGNSREPSLFRNRAFSMSLSPSAGYFVAKNLVVGASVPISYASSTNYLSSGSRSDTDVGVGLAPFARYYIGSARLRPFINASVGFQQFWFTRSGFGGEPARSSVNMTNYSVGGGVAYFVNNTVSLDASLNYMNGLGGSGFRQRGRADLNIGFRLFFGK